MWDKQKWFLIFCSRCDVQWKSCKCHFVLFRCYCGPYITPCLTLTSVSLAPFPTKGKCVFCIARYDIKGCEVSRWTEPAPEGSQIIVVLKDLNFEGQFITLGKKTVWCVLWVIWSCVKVVWVALLHHLGLTVRIVSNMVPKCSLLSEPCKNT